MKYHLIDVAGINDSTGLFIDIINSMVIKCIFEKVDKIKFILTITIDDLVESKGRGLREMIEQL